MVGKKVELETRNIQEKGRRKIMKRKLWDMRLLIIGLFMFVQAGFVFAEVSNRNFGTFLDLEGTSVATDSKGLNLTLALGAGAGTQSQMSDDKENEPGTWLAAGGSATDDENPRADYTLLGLLVGARYDFYNRENAKASTAMTLDFLTPMTSDSYESDGIGLHTLYFLYKNPKLPNYLGAGSLRFVLGKYATNEEQGGFLNVRGGYGLAEPSKAAFAQKVSWANNGSNAGNLNAIQPNNTAAFIDTTDLTNNNVQAAVHTQRNVRAGGEMTYGYNTAFGTKIGLGLHPFLWINQDTPNNTPAGLTETSAYTLGVDASLSLPEFMKMKIQGGVAFKEDNTATGATNIDSTIGAWGFTLETSLFDGINVPVLGKAFNNDRLSMYATWVKNTKDAYEGSTKRPLDGWAGAVGADLKVLSKLSVAKDVGIFAEIGRFSGENPADDGDFSGFVGLGSNVSVLPHAPLWLMAKDVLVFSDRTNTSHTGQNMQVVTAGVKFGLWSWSLFKLSAGTSGWLREQMSPGANVSGMGKAYSFAALNSRVKFHDSFPELNWNLTWFKTGDGITSSALVPTNEFATEVMMNYTF